MTFRVLLVTTMRWPSAPRLAEAFVDAACSVEAVFPRGHVLAKSRFLAKGYGYHAVAPLLSIKDAIVQSQADLIVPLDDRATSHLQLLWQNARDQEPAIAERIAHSLGRMESYPRLAARAPFIAAAQNEDIATPRTRALTDSIQIEAAIAQFGLPLVLKSDGSWGGGGVALAESREAAHSAFEKLSAAPSRARSLFRAFKRRDAHFLMEMLMPQTNAISAQEFIPGTAATTAFACWRGRLLASNHYDVVVARDGNGPACVLRHIESPEMENAAAKLAARFGLSGLHGLDFMRDASGKPLLIEINPRATQTAHLGFGERADLVAALTAAARDCPVTARLAATQNEFVALFPQEIMRDPLSPWLAEAFHDLPWRDSAVLSAVAPGKSLNSAQRRGWLDF